jgi:hypothetical protein
MLGVQCQPPSGPGASAGSGGVQTGSTGPLRVGVAAVVVTPVDFETWVDGNGNGEFEAGETFLDAGVDRLFNPDEPGALGPDGAPGVAGLDDDANGTIDDRSEYGWPGGDDIFDPSGDDFHARTNPTGTEGDGVFQSLVIAGFQGAYSGRFTTTSGRAPSPSNATASGSSCNRTTSSGCCTSTSTR